MSINHPESGDSGKNGKALVLGGGGITGIAWEIGLLYGLAQAGIDLTDADLIVGTSAGSFVGALIASGIPLATLYAQQREPPTDVVGARLGRGFVVRWMLAMAMPGSRQRARARLGHAALRAKTGPETERIAVFSGAFPRNEWPAQPLLITAVDAESGVAVTFDREGVASLVEAVAASCAVPLVWPPISIKGHRYVDGGVRSPANVDLARGYERVVAIVPINGSLRRADRPEAQAAALGPGVRYVVISPDAAAIAAIGKNVLDPAKRAASAEAGCAQATSIAERVRAVWA